MSFGVIEANSGMVSLRDRVTHHSETTALRVNIGSYFLFTLPTVRGWRAVCSRLHTSIVRTHYRRESENEIEKTIDLLLSVFLRHENVGEMKSVSCTLTVANARLVAILQQRTA
jgi:hypothetical protein